MGNENKTKENDLSQLGNVDQIREILFGSQSREMKEQFEKLENSIKSLHDEMRKKIEQTQNDFNSRIESELEVLSRKMKNIVTQQQNEFSDVRDSALKQEKRLQSAMDIMEEELNTKREQLQKQHIESNSALRSEMDMLKDELLSTLDDKISSMNGVKLSRDDAAEILMEAAMAMKGTQINQQLNIAQEK
jgi:CII-binding regulator of phage lambda lysogenization HflD